MKQKSDKSEFFKDFKIKDVGDERGLCAVFKDKAYHLKNGKRETETIYTEDILKQRTRSARAHNKPLTMEEEALINLQRAKAAAQRRAAQLNS